MSVEACVLLHLRKRAVARASGAAALLWLGRDVAMVHRGLAWRVVELTPEKALATLFDEHGALAKLHDDERGFFFVPEHVRRGTLDLCRGRAFARQRALDSP